MGPYVCPRCGTLVNEVPAICRVCGTKLTPPSRPEGTRNPSPAQPRGSDSWLELSRGTLLWLVLVLLLGSPWLFYLALQALAFLSIPFRSGNSGGPAVIGGVVFVAAAAGIVLIDRRASRNALTDAGCFLVLIAVALLSGLVMVLSLCNL